MYTSTFSSGMHTHGTAGYELKNIDPYMTVLCAFAAYTQAMARKITQLFLLRS
jgi:hypothetical protein